jgi:NAD(P)-dependent dehydrogenase (short-subunit alcohol dehydrogenase family)
MSFAGKQAIVTGAGSGIGAALCRALASAGADVICTDIDGDAAERTASALGANARPARLDVTDAEAVQATVDEVVNRAGRLDLIFNNAGIVWGGDTELLTLDQWNAIIDVNIRGVVHGVAAAYPLMIRQGHGHIINTASMAGLTAAGPDHQLCDDQACRCRNVDGAAVGGRATRRRRAGCLPGRRGNTDPRQGRGRRFRRP